MRLIWAQLAQGQGYTSMWLDDAQNVCFACAYLCEDNLHYLNSGIIARSRSVVGS